MTNQPSRRRAAAWQAGVAQVDITPRAPLWLHGWGNRTKPMQGISHPVYVKALALRDSAGAKSVLVTADLLGFSRKMTVKITARAQRRFGLDRARLILNASHNHSGPLTAGVLPLYFDLTPEFRAKRDRYTPWLIDQVVNLIGTALDDLAPARLDFGQGLAGIAVNRRRARAGGRHLPTVVDQDVPVLAVRTPRGALRAVVFGYACHTTCVNDDTLNADYAGFAQRDLEALHPGAVALFVQGCGGDTNPLPRWRPGLGEAYGRILATAVDQVLEGAMATVGGPLRAAFAEATLPFEPLPTAAQLRAMLPGRTGLRRREVTCQLSLLTHGDRRPRSLAYPLHVWQFGDDLTFVGLSSEPVADYSLRFKQAYGVERTWVAGYNDDYWCYIPSLRVWTEGGYEGTTGMLECQLPGPFTAAVEEIIAAGVDELVQATCATPRPYPRPSAVE